MAVPEFVGPSPADLGTDLAAGSTFTLLHYRWDGTVRDDGTRRYRLDPASDIPVVASGDLRHGRLDLNSSRSSKIGS